MSKELEMRGDLSKSFSKIVDSMYIEYLGCHIEKIKRGNTIGYRWNDKPFDTLEEAKNEVDVAYDILQHSIKGK